MVVAFGLLAIAVLIGTETVAPGLEGRWGGTFFLAMMALPFWITYVLRRGSWWAVIPGGTLATLAIVAALPPGDAVGGTVFLVGLGATFGLVYMLPKPGARARWALIPAVVLLLLGLLVATASYAFNYIWPVALILGGLYLLFRVQRPRYPSQPVEAPIPSDGAEKQDDVGPGSPQAG